MSGWLVSKRERFSMQHITYKRERKENIKRENAASTNTNKTRKTSKTLPEGTYGFLIRIFHTSNVCNRELRQQNFELFGS